MKEATADQEVCCETKVQDHGFRETQPAARAILGGQLLLNHVSLDEGPLSPFFSFNIKDCMLYVHLFLKKGNHLLHPMKANLFSFPVAQCIVLDSWKENIQCHQDLLGVKQDARCRADKKTDLFPVLRVWYLGPFYSWESG